MKDYKYSNLKFWDSIVQEHLQSDFYDVPGFLAGKTSLDSLELEHCCCWPYSSTNPNGFEKHDGSSSRSRGEEPFLV